MNKATVGLCNAMFGKRTYSGTPSALSFTDGAMLPGINSCSISVTYDEAKLYGDNVALVDHRSFKEGTMEFKVAQFDDTNYAYLIGATVSTISQSSDKVVQYSADDAAPYVCFGMIADGITLASGDYEEGYTAVWFPKVKFTEGNQDLQTRGDSTQFNLPQVTASILADPETSNEWKEVATFSTLTAANTWLKGKCGVS